MESMEVKESGVFCLAWKVRDEILSVWSNSSEQILNLYFTMRKRLENIEVWYFPTSEHSIKVFGGKNGILD